MKDSFGRKMIKRQSKWAGHVHGMEVDRMTEGRRRRVRPNLRWETCVNKELMRVGGEWRTRPREGECR